MPMDRLDIISEAAKIAASVKVIFGKLKGIHGGIKGVWKAAPVVVEEVESAARAWFGVTGADKKAMAVEAILLVIPDRWWFPDWFARPVIGIAIEQALKALKKAGKGIFKKTSV